MFSSKPQVIILYFIHDKNAISTLSTEMSFKRRAREQLITALGLEGNEIDYRDRIFIALNTAMFLERKQ